MVQVVVHDTGGAGSDLPPTSFDLDPSEEQRLLLSALSSLLQRWSPVSVVRSSEVAGDAPQLWERLQDFGLLAMAYTDNAERGMVDLVLACELLGEYLAPAPVAEAAAALRLLARLSTPVAAGLLADAATGRVRATLAVRAPVHGVAVAVPSGALAGVVLARQADRVVVAVAGPPPVIANIGSLPLADRDLAPAQEVASGARACAHYETALAEYRLMTAAYLIGAARRCLEIGIEYTMGRTAFGRPIASFQTIAHRLADLATQLEAARMVVLEAAWGFDEQQNRRFEWASMAIVLSAEAAEAAATDVLHFHGGYGFMLEYDIQLYFKKIKGLILSCGDPQDELAALADRLWPR